ncbi:MAG: hypothetical protein ACOX7R_04160 [Acetivibrionales bacterium]
MLNNRIMREIERRIVSIISAWTGDIIPVDEGKEVTLYSVGYQM